MDERIKKLLRLYTEEERKHGERVLGYARSLLDKLGTGSIYKDSICTAALLHDIGKGYIKAHIVYKPQALTVEEFRVMKRHSAFGYFSMRTAGFGDEIALCVLHHHEDFCGGGYPQGLKGSRIPFGASVIRICDTFDAITSDRPYQRAKSDLEAIEIMDRDSRLFDPLLYPIFREMILGERNSFTLLQGGVCIEGV